MRARGSVEPATPPRIVGILRLVQHLTACRINGLQFHGTGRDVEQQPVSFLELLIGSDGPIPPEPDPELAQRVGFMLAEPGEDVVEEVSLPSGDYVMDCATFEGDRPSHAWRAAAIQVEG